jgi:hypothetical protein
MPRNDERFLNIYPQQYPQLLDLRTRDTIRVIYFAAFTFPFFLIRLVLLSRE